MQRALAQPPRSPPSAAMSVVAESGPAACPALAAHPRRPARTRPSRSPGTAVNGAASFWRHPRPCPVHPPCSVSLYPLAPSKAATRVQPRLQYRASGRLVDVGAGLPPLQPLLAEVPGGERGRQALVPKLYRAARPVRDPLRQRPRLSSGRALAAPQIERKPYDEPPDAVFLDHAPERLDDALGVLGRQGPARMRQKAQFVVDRDTDARVAGIDPARSEAGPRVRGGRRVHPSRVACRETRR